jgi:hypothetical protein
MAKQKSNKTNTENLEVDTSSVESEKAQEVAEDTILLSDLVKKMKSEGKTYVRIQKLF